MNTVYRPTVLDAHTTPGRTLVIKLSNGVTIRSRNNDYQWVFVYAWSVNDDLIELGTKPSGSIYKRTNNRKNAQRLLDDAARFGSSVTGRTRGDYILLRRRGEGRYEEVTTA